MQFTNKVIRGIVGILAGIGIIVLQNFLNGNPTVQWQLYSAEVGIALCTFLIGLMLTLDVVRSYQGAGVYVRIGSMITGILLFLIGAIPQSLWWSLFPYDEYSGGMAWVLSAVEGGSYIATILCLSGGVLIGKSFAKKTKLIF